MKNNKTLLFLLKVITLSVLFSLALHFENAQQHRFYILSLVFLLYLILNYIKFRSNYDTKIYFSLFYLEIIVIYILEYNSRLLINYFFQPFYIIIIIEGILTLNLKNGFIVGASAIIVSLLKYIYLTYLNFNLANVLQMFSFLTMNILILLASGFAQYNKEERQKKELLYRELFDAHKKLKQYSEEVSRLSKVEERNRIARDLHDTLGHNMTALIMQLQMVQHFYKTDDKKAEDMLCDSLKTARNSMLGIRDVVETLRGSDYSMIPLDSIKKLAEEFSEKTGTEINLDIKNEYKINTTPANAVLYRILQETMTNSVRHGKAEIIKINLEFTRSYIKFFICDNGTGVSNITEGYGLKGIRERVKKFNGHVKFENDHGFKTEGILYLEGNYDKSNFS